MRRNAFIALIAIAVALVLNVDAHAARPQPSLTITCDVYPGNTVVDYPVGTYSIEVIWYDGAGQTGTSVGHVQSSIKGGSLISYPTPDGAASYWAQVFWHGPVPNGARTVGSCN